MKVSLNWIKEYVDIDLSVEELVEKIGAQLGGVDEVIDIGKKYKGIVVAKVVKCEKHPNADKLKVCLIDDNNKTKNVKRNNDGLVELVCGAPNVRAGMKVAWLPPGATVPATFDKDPLVLDAREIRGVVSNGMLASGSELGLSDDHSGILELKYGEVGDDFAVAVELDDCIVDIENKMFTHRPDCFGMLGVAREIAGITQKQFKSPDSYLNQDPQNIKIDSKLEVRVANKIPNLVPRFTARVIENVELKPSSEKIQADLRKIGIRPINNIVDITNWMMCDTAQPLHAYDYDKLCKVAGTKTPQIETRLSKKGDELKMLNGKTINFQDAETILITSNDVPVGIGGVMGGSETEVDENTKSVVLECANFDMYSIRRSSMRHGIFSDAVTRFNKGQSPLQIPPVMQLATSLMQTVCGQEAKAGKLSDEHSNMQKPIAVHVTQQFINDRLGLELTIKEMAKLLKNVEFEVKINGPTLVVTPPFWRTDIEIAEDVVEEVGRLYGYDHMPLVLPKRTINPAPKNSGLELKNKIRDSLRIAGANEVLTYSFVHGQLLQNAGQKPENSYQLSNALSPDLQYYRQTLTPSLLDKVHMNIKAGHDEFAIYEINKTHNKKHSLDQENVPQEIDMTALVYASKLGKAGESFYRVRRQLDYLARKLGMRLEYSPIESKDSSSDLAPYELSRSAHVKDTKTGIQIGIIGEFQRSVLSNFKLPQASAGFEVKTSLVHEVIGKLDSSNYQPLPRFPKVEQDITLRVASDLGFGFVESRLDKSIKLLQPKNCVSVLNPISIFQKDKDKTHKQISFRINIACHDRTLTSQEVNSLLDEVIETNKTTLNADRI